MLLDWGITCAKKIAQGTLGLDDMEAENVMYQPMRATRRLMSSINRWVSRYEILGDEGHVDFLKKIIEQAGVIYGNEYIPPSANQQQTLLAAIPELVGDTPKLIAKLRSDIERDTTSSSLVS